MSALTQEQASNFLVDFLNALGTPDVFDQEGGLANVFDGLLTAVGELTDSMSYSAYAEKANYTASANSLAKWAQA